MIKRTNSENKDFISLVKALDAYLKIIDDNEHEFYNQ
jgi:putative acetyltransferase